MTKKTMKHITPKLAITLAVFCLFMACKKELSVENGGFAGTAQGELVDSLGNCKNVTIRGTYAVDTPLTNNNFVEVNVNFTAPGKYKIYTDTVNGMWFLDSGFAISVGPSVVKIKGKGTPILAKNADFNLFFNNTMCSFRVPVSGSGSGGGSGGGGGTGGAGNADYFPTSSGSTWTYQYIPKLGNVDTFRVTVGTKQVTVANDSLTYSQFGTSLLDTFYFAKASQGNYYALSTVDFDYTFLFDSIPNKFISYIFLKENAAVGDTWQSGEYGTVKLVSGTTTERGDAKAVFTVISKNTTPYTIGGKVYSNVINIKREIMFKPNTPGGTYKMVLAGNAYYAKGFGLIDQVFSATPSQSVSLFRTPTIK